MIKEITKTQKTALLLSIFIISVCGLTYELLLGYFTSYVLGDPVTHYSLTIGLFVTSLGFGSLLSRYITKNLIKVFIYIEIALGIIGAFSIPILSYIFIKTEEDIFLFSAIFIIIVIGILVGLELPILTRFLSKFEELRKVISDVFSIDYLGGFAAGILFPWFLLPKLGQIKVSLLIGGMNIAVGFYALLNFRSHVNKWGRILLLSLMSFINIGIAFFLSGEFTGYFQKELFQDEIIFYKRTKFQEIVITKWRKSIKLFLDGHIQFNTLDEYRYHESLVHPLLTNLPNRENILILGGGDGMAAREVLKYPDVNSITLVDIDREITDLFKKNDFFAKLNNYSLRNPKVKIINTDAFTYIKNSSNLYNAIIIDFPDPHNELLAKLYTYEFYSYLKKHLAKYGGIVTQATSPIGVKKAFWCIYKTIQNAMNKSGQTIPYHTYIPSFGDWGFVLYIPSSKKVLQLFHLPKGLKFLSEKTFSRMLIFPKDLILPLNKIKINTLINPILFYYYRKSYSELW